MILTKTPLRISFVGGGSDRPSFYNEEPGACVAASIDKFVWVAVNPKYDDSIRAAYSVTENVQTVDELQHELIREALSMLGPQSGVEVHSIADIPGGTGLGSSSAFTVGLCTALRKDRFGPRWYAEDAIEIELNRCHKTIGKQDQYTAAYGGLNLLGFTSKGVTVDPIVCDLDALSSHCLLLDTGLARVGDAGAVLAGQQQDRDEVRQLAWLAQCFAKLLSEGDLEACGSAMNAAWDIKSRFASNKQIDHWFDLAYHTGAWGGKLCGAGGGGFLLFLAPPETHTTITTALGLRRVPIRVGVEGCHVVHHS